MLSLNAITRSLQAYWAEHAPPELPTLFPGTAPDMADCRDWYEVWVDLTDEQPRRSGAPDRATLFITIHCFSTDRTDLLRAESLSDIAAGILSRRTLTLFDPLLPPTPVGRLRFQEAQRRTLSRSHVLLSQGRLQHLVVTLNAYATETSC